VQRALSREKGVLRASVGLATEEALVVFNATFTSADKLVEAVEDIGFRAQKVTNA
jgi:copper chaperone CopZ